MTSTANTGGRRLNATEKRLDALTLRRRGSTFREIADKLGCSRAMVHKYVAGALREYAAANKEETEVYRALEADRLDALHAAIWPKAMNGDMRAVDRVLRIMERRAKLFGLDAPTKVAATTPDGDEQAPAAVVVLPPIASGVDDWLDRYRSGATAIIPTADRIEA